MPGGNGFDQKLQRAIESSISAIPKTIRQAYPEHELVNSVFVILKARRCRNPSKLVVRSAAIDHHRRETHFNPGSRTRPRNPNKRKVQYGDIPQKSSVGAETTRDEIAAALRDIRRRHGNDGLTVFLLTRIMELDPRTVTRIMDFEPNSALARTVQDLGAPYNP